MAYTLMATIILLIKLYHLKKPQFNLTGWDLSNEGTFMALVGKDTIEVWQYSILKIERADFNFTIVKEAAVHGMDLPDFF